MSIKIALIVAALMLAGLSGAVTNEAIRRRVAPVSEQPLPPVSWTMWDTAPRVSQQFDEWVKSHDGWFYEVLDLHNSGFYQITLGWYRSKGAPAWRNGQSSDYAHITVKGRNFPIMEAVIHTMADNGNWDQPMLWLPWNE